MMAGEAVFDLFYVKNYGLVSDFMILPQTAEASSGAAR